MSLERIYKRAVRDIKKRDAAKQTHQAQSQAQLDAVMKASKTVEAKRFPEASEGVPCRACGQRVTGSLADLAAHRESH